METHAVKRRFGIPTIVIVLVLGACDDDGDGVGPTSTDTLSIDVRVDSTLEPRIPSLPGFAEGEDRPVAAMTDSAGPPADFVENELILVTDDQAELDAFVERWNGEVLLTYDPAQYELEGAPQHLVRVDAAAADVSALVADLRSLDENAAGDVRVSSPAAERLFAAAAREAVGGATVGLNWIGAGAGDFRDESTGEAPNFLGGSRYAYDPDAYTWSYMQLGGNQDIGVTEAWTMLDWAGRLGNKVKIAVLDMGFTESPDVSPVRTIISNAAGISAAEVMGRRSRGNCGSPCPWHGTHVLSAAMGIPDNGAGAAGSAGPVGEPVIVYTQYGMWRSVVALARARRAGARIANMSYSTAVPAIASFTVRPFNIATRRLRNRGMLIFAAAGNDGKNIDSKRRVLRFEKKWYAPCENDGVICVGGLAWNSKSRDDDSNRGKENVDIYGPYTLFSVGDPDVGSDDRAILVNGTSFASPFVAGVAALIWAAQPRLGAGQVQDILFSTAHSSPDDDVERYVDAYEAVVAALGSRPPEIRISSPSEGERTPRGIAVVFSATSSDPEDGAPPITWRSDRDGTFGSGTRVVRDDLSYGLHTISAATTDAAGLTAVDSVHIEIVNNAPAMDIVNPTDGAEFYEGESIPLRGTSFDQNRPPERSLTDAEVHWTSTLAGALGTGHELDTSALNEGTHTIVFTGTDEVGATGADSILLFVRPPPTDYPPAVTITEPEPGSGGAAVFNAEGEETVDGRTLYYADVLLEGVADDPEDGALSGSSLVWTTDRTDLQSNPLGTGTRQTVRLYSDGGCGDEHLVTLTATDSAGNSRSAEIRIIISVLC